MYDIGACIFIAAVNDTNEITLFRGCRFVRTSDTATLDETVPSCDSVVISNRCIGHTCYSGSACYYAHTSCIFVWSSIGLKLSYAGDANGCCMIWMEILMRLTVWQINANRSGSGTYSLPKWLQRIVLGKAKPSNIAELQSEPPATIPTIISFNGLMGGIANILPLCRSVGPFQMKLVCQSPLNIWQTFTLIPGWTLWWCCNGSNSAACISWDFYQHQRTRASRSRSNYMLIWGAAENSIW